MYNKLVINIKNNFKLYKRSKLLIVLSIIFFCFYGLTTLPTLFMTSASSRLLVISRILSSFNGFSTFFIIILMLVGIIHPIRNRSLKMIITKPCLPRTWLLSNYISAIFIFFFLNLIVYILISALFLLWNIPFQWGLVFIFIHRFFHAVILLSYITLLAVAIGTWGAVVFGIILTEGFFFYFSNMFLALKESVSNNIGKIILLIFQKIFYFIYLILPVSEPFSKETGPIYRSLRVTSSDWKYLLFTMLYAILISRFLYLLSVVFLNKKRLI